MKHIRYSILGGILFIISGNSLCAQIYLNEILAENQALYKDSDYQEYSDYLELYNAGNTYVNLSGWKISDRPDPADAYVIPDGIGIAAGKYIRFWADGKNAGMHTSFKLNEKGESLYLYDSNSVLHDQMSFPEQYPNIAYGREGDAPGIWGFMENISPAGPNPAKSSLLRLDIPELSLEGGFYTTQQQLTLRHPERGSQILYTLDGSNPLENGITYANPIRLDTSQVIRIVAKHRDYLSSPIISRSFFIQEAHPGLPVISLISPPKNLWNDTIGIYTSGTHGIPGPADTIPRNYYQDWERPVELEFYEEDKNLGFRQKLGMKIFGHASRSRPQKSLALFARKEYGKGSINYPLFKSKEAKVYESFILRNSGSEWRYTFYRDAAHCSFVNDVTHVSCQDYQPAVIYLNGVYWGILNMREKINEDFVQNNYGVNSEEIDILFRDSRAVEGKAHAYKTFLDSLNMLDLSQMSAYEYVKSQIDIDNYLDYQITQIFLDNKDWPGSNIKYWRHSQGGSKWRWIMYDTDRGSGLYGDSVSFNTLAYAKDPNGDPFGLNAPWATFLFRKLLESPEFTKLFITRFQTHLNSTFAPERTLGILNDIRTAIETEIPAHQQRWGKSVSFWQEQTVKIHNYFKQRPSEVQKHLASEFNLSSPEKLYLLSGDPAIGKVQVNGVWLEDDLYGSVSPEFPISLYAKSGPGHRFSHWEYSEIGADTLIKSGELWKYWDIPTGAFPNWTQNWFDDSFWFEGPSELGYGDNDENTSLASIGINGNTNTTVYFRKSINLSLANLPQRIAVRLKRDDGAVVYLNGEKVTQLNLSHPNPDYYTYADTTVADNRENHWDIIELHPFQFKEGENVFAVEIHQASPRSPDLSFDFELLAFKEGAHIQNLSGRKEELSITGPSFIKAIFLPGNESQLFAGLYINEILADNQSNGPDANDRNGDWIEIYNDKVDAVNLGGLFLTDDLSKPRKWQIPFDKPYKTTLAGKGFIRVWANKKESEGTLQANFRLSAAGETLALVDPGGNIIDQIQFPALEADQSYGRYPDASNNWRIYSPGETSPLAPNISQNTPPEFTSSPISRIHVGEEYTYWASGMDAEGNIVRISAECLPDWLELFDYGNDEIALYGIPGREHIGYHRIRLKATDGFIQSQNFQEFIVEVYDSGTTPVNPDIVQSASLYPNPSEGTFTYVQESIPGKEFHLKLLDLQGRIIWQEKIKTHGHVLQKQISIDQAGLFFLSVSSEQKFVHTMKLMIR